MAVIQPQTEIRLVKCPLELSDLNQLTFTNTTVQYNYFNSLPHIIEDNATYQRKDGFIRFPAEMDDIIEYNYVMYQNEAYSNKWFYAYIDHMEYLSNGTTAVYIKTDVFQTWQHSLIYRQSFVEREMAVDDSIGANTVPEDLEKGPYVNNYNGVIEMDASPEGDYNLVVFQVSELLDNTTLMNLSTQFQYCGIFSGLYMFGVRVQEARNFVKAYAAKGKSDAIIAIFYASGAFFDERVAVTIYTGPDSTLPVGTYYSPVKNTAYSVLLKNSTTVPINTTIDGYTPRNNKLFTKDYNYLYITNNAGSDIIYQYELFQNNTPTFYITGVPSQGCSIKLVPQNYKNNAENYAEGINCGKLPLCAWATDYYTNWVTQNAVNISAGLVTGVGSAILGGAASLATGNAIGVVGSGVSLFGAVANTVGEIDRASKIPDQAQGNVNSGDLNFSGRRYFFHYQKMSVRAEYARIIDDYFTMYGYKTNRVKIPNCFGRSNWNFVKTVGCYIQADIPQDDLQQIKEMFDTGITLWHDPATFLDYSQANNII